MFPILFFFNSSFLFLGCKSVCLYSSFHSPNSRLIFSQADSLITHGTGRCGRSRAFCYDWQVQHLHCPIIASESKKAIVLIGLILASGLSYLQFVDISSLRNLTVLGLALAGGIHIPVYAREHHEGKRSS